MLSLYSSLSFQNNYLGKFLWGCCFGVFVGFYVTCVVTAGDLFFSKKGKRKTFSIAKLDHQRNSSWKRCQSYKKYMFKKFSFFFLSLQLCWSFSQRLYLAVKGRKGKQAWKRLCSGKAWSWSPHWHRNALLCSPAGAWCWASCSLVTDLLLFPVIEKWIFCPERREQ